jgi:hypothetical protein
MVALIIFFLRAAVLCSQRVVVVPLHIAETKYLGGRHIRSAIAIWSGSSSEGNDSCKDANCVWEIA